MICPSCGFDNADHESRCWRCCASLQPAEDEARADHGAAGEHSPPEVREHARADPQEIRKVGRRAVLARPRGVRVEQTGDTLRITRRWFHPLAFVVVLVLVPSLIWCGVTGRAGLYVSARYATLANVLALAFGVSCIYLLGLVLFNRTVVEVTSERVSFSHGPLPWIMPRRVVGAREITQVFCVDHARDIDLGVRDYDYELKATMADGQTVSLLEDIPNLKQARYLEQEIERRLGIADRPVPGEHPY